MSASLLETFTSTASARLALYPELEHEWIESASQESTTLRIPRHGDTGFDVSIKCEPYGLYPHADGWHGAPWDAKTPSRSLEEIVEDCLGFVRTILSRDAKLLVHLAGGSPYKWVLHYYVGDKPIADETGLLFFNYFGRREIREYQNDHLPPRVIHGSAI